MRHKGHFSFSDVQCARCDISFTAGCGGHVHTIIRSLGVAHVHIRCVEALL